MQVIEVTQVIEVIEVDGKMQDIKNLDWLEIFLGYKCNVKCNFCYQKNLRIFYKENIKKSDVINLLDNWYKSWKRFVIFSWWEPTLDKNLEYYIKYSNTIWFKHIRVHTNGFMFNSYDYTLNLYKAWLTWVTISIHWYKEKHDQIVWVNGSFNIIINALKNFQKIKVNDNSFVYDTNTVVTKDNYKNLPKLINFLSFFNLTRWQIVLSYSLDLFNIKEKKNIIPRYEKILPYLKKSLNISIVKNKRFVLENVPFCVIDKRYWWKIISNIKINKSSITIKEWNIWNTNLTWMVSSLKCKSCYFVDKCRWIPKDYYEAYWDNCLTPIYG